MANWSKRRSTKAGNQGQRITRTTNTSGKTTYSSSRRVGNTRITDSTSGGKTKVYITEHHPILGTRRTVRTVNPTVRVKKPKKPKKNRSRKYNTSSTNTGEGFNPFAPIIWWISVPYSGWITVAAILLFLSSPWYIWLIYFSAYLKFNVDFFK